MGKVTYREAIRDAIREALYKDPRVFLMGEDVGQYGGVLRSVRGYWPSLVQSASGIRRSRNRPL